MRIYIAGPMTGLPESNYPAFNAAAAAWRNAGWDVVNPAEHFGADQTLPYRNYVEADLAELKTCDAIAMLPGWDAPTSRGSVWEREIAKTLLGIPVLDATHPVEPLGVDTGAQILLVDYDEYRAFQGWRNSIVRSLRSVGKQELQQKYLAEFVNAAVPITRNEAGVLGRHTNG